MDRIPPQSLEAEQSTLGSMMIDKGALEKCSALLTSGDFYRDAHSTIFETMMRLVQKKEPVDLVTVQEDLKERSKLEMVGNTEYLMALVDTVASALNAEWYAQKVKDCSLRRQCIDMATTLAQSAHDRDKPFPEVVAYGQTGILNLAKEGNRKSYTHIREAASEAFERIEARYHDPREITGIPTGIHALDSQTMGWQNGDYIFIAARPSNGKTALMLQCAMESSTVECPSGIFSVEMSKEQLAMRMLSHKSRVSGRSLRSGKIDDAGWERICDSYGKMYDWPMYICDETNLHIRDIPTIARSMVLEHGVKFLMLDYIQLVIPNKAPSRNEQVADISRTLKSVARELQVPFIVLSQLSRPAKNMREAEPTKEDLRDSGSLEQDADVVIMIHNPKNPDDPQGFSPRPAVLIGDKQRNLNQFRAEVMWDGNFQIFADKEKDQAEPKPDALGSWQNATWG